jgi:hypothetical protein
MENPTTLLVAIMFVTILAMAIGSILMACAEIAGGLRRPAPERIQLSWILLMLFILLNLFWETTAILEIDQWRFTEFLYVIAGPIVLLFATGVIASPEQASENSQRYDHYLGLSRRFFIMLALHDAWIIGIDIWFQNLNILSLVNGLLLILFLLLAFSRSLRIHVAGALLAWGGYVVELVLRSLAAPGIQ